MIDSEWLSHTITAVGTAVISLTAGIGGAWLFLRRGQLRLRADQADQQAKDDANTIRGWKELVDERASYYKIKNQEQDARMAAMTTETDTRMSAMTRLMDEMHKAHLDCEKKAAMREAEAMKNAAENHIMLRQHEAVIVDLTRRLDAVEKNKSVTLQIEQLPSGDKLSTT